MLRLLASLSLQARISSRQTLCGSRAHAAQRMSWPIFPDAFGCTTSNVSAIKFRFRLFDKRDYGHDNDEHDNNDRDFTGEKNSQPCLAKNAAEKFSKCFS